MERSIALRIVILAFLYICKAIFHAALVQGRSLPFFRTTAYENGT
ncbi:RAxF-45 family protein [Bacillus testis]|nr:RAxF-45 family protein [Bacillus testis]